MNNVGVHVLLHTWRVMECKINKLLDVVTGDDCQQWKGWEFHGCTRRRRWWWCAKSEDVGVAGIDWNNKRRWIKLLLHGWVQNQRKERKKITWVIMHWQDASAGLLVHTRVAGGTCVHDHFWTCALENEPVRYRTSRFKKYLHVEAIQTLKTEPAG